MSFERESTTRERGIFSVAQDATSKPKRESALDARSFREFGKQLKIISEDAGVAYRETTDRDELAKRYEVRSLVLQTLHNSDRGFDVDSINLIHPNNLIF